MSLSDVLTGMRNGPRGGGFGGGRSSGLSPILLAALGLLAYKAVKSFNNAPQPAQHPRGASQPGAPAASGGLGGILQSLGLGGGAAAGSGGLGGILSGGLGDLIKQFQNAGKGEMALEGLSQQLPEVVDKLTPQGRLPAPQEIDRA